MKIRVKISLFFLLGLVSNLGLASIASPELEVKPSLKLSSVDRDVYETNGFSVNENAFYWQFNSSSSTNVESFSVTTQDGEDRQGKLTEYTKAKSCYLLMADTSKSMAPFWSNTLSTMGKFVEQSNDDVAVYGFAESLQEIVPFKSGKSDDEIVNTINDLSMDGNNTQLYSAIDNAISRIASCEAGRRAIVVFSDGDAEDLAINLSQVVDLAKKNKVNIHTIGFGDLNRKNTVLKLQVLSTLSDKTNGSYHYFKDNAQYKDFIVDLLNVARPQGYLAVSSELLPFATKSVIFTIKVKDMSGSVTPIAKEIPVNNTTNIDNMLITIKDKTGFENPWYLIILVVFIVILIIGVFSYLMIRSKRKRNVEIKERELSELQRQQELEKQQKNVQKAIDDVKAKIDDFQPAAPVLDVGIPYGWLQDKYGNRYPLVKFSSTIGRSEDNDVVIKNDSAVSGQHAILDFKKGLFFWTDRAPLNVSSINNLPVQGSTKFQPGDVIACGATELTLLLG